MCQQKIVTDQNERNILGFDREVINATVSYYSRLAIWVTVLELSIIFFGYAKIASLKALKAVLAYCFLLGILILLKTKYPQRFNTFKWFCTPAIIFLKSWSSLFFFVYLVQLPLQLGSVAPEQVISWLFQIALGMDLNTCIYYIEIYINNEFRTLVGSRDNSRISHHSLVLSGISLPPCD